MSIVLINPEAYPQTDAFREGIVEIARAYFDRIRDIDAEEYIQLVGVLVARFDVVIAVRRSSPDVPDLYEFFTIKGAALLRKVATTGKPKAFSMVGFPIFDFKLAATIRDLCGDGADLH
jgi:hypothetical protein